MKQTLFSDLLVVKTEFLLAAISSLRFWMVSREIWINFGSDLIPVILRSRVWTRQVQIDTRGSLNAWK